MKSLLYIVFLLIAAYTPISTTAKTVPSRNPSEALSLKNMFNELLHPYLAIKDALVNEDAQKAKEAAQELRLALNSLRKTGLSEDFHSSYLKSQKALINYAEKISSSKNIAQQRTAFAELSTTLFPLAKAAKMDIPIYYQHCPMYAQGKGGNWLSLEKPIKNPLYGKKMLSCGSTVETISIKD